MIDSLDLFLPDGSARDPVCECGTLKSKHNVFFFRCAGFRLPHAPDMRRESAALVAGANSAATKRARGQELIPTLHLSGSTPRKRRVRAKEAA